VANRTGRGQNIPTLTRATGSVSAIPRVQHSATSPASGDQAQSFDMLSRELGHISRKIGKQLDNIAREEGYRAGVRAAASDDVALRQDGTIRGQSFDAAAIRTMIARHDTESRQAAERLYQDHKSNPAKLEQMFDQYKKGVMASGLPDEVATNFSFSFDRLKTAYASDAQRLSEKRQYDEDRAAAFQANDERKKTIGRLAVRASADPEADTLLAEEIKDYQDFLVTYGPKEEFTFDGVAYPASQNRAGALSLQEIQSFVVDATAEAKELRVIGAFSDIDELDEKKKYLNAFDAAFSDGESEFNLDQRDRLVRRMKTEINAMESGVNGVRRLVNENVREMKSRMEKGFSPGEDFLSGIEDRAKASGDVEAINGVRYARDMISFQETVRQWRPDQLQGWINEERSRINSRGSAGQIEVDRVDMAEKLLSNMETELRRDPLSWAARVGLRPVGSLQFSGEEAPVSVKARLEDALAVSEHYGTPVKLMTDEEVTQWKNAYDELDVDGRVGLIGLIQQGFGDQSIHAFRDISKASPALANVGGLLSASEAHKATARDFAVGDFAIAEGLKVQPDSGQDQQDIMHDTVGNAYGEHSAAMRAVTDTADRLYAAEAVRRGLNPADFGKNKDIYERALQRATGAWFDDDGQQYGGVVEWRGNHKIVLPFNVSEDAFRTAIANVTVDELIDASVGGIAPTDMAGRPLLPERVEDMYLVSAGPGRYLISVTDPVKGAASYLHGGNRDGLFELDANKLLGGGE